MDWLKKIPIGQYVSGNSSWLRGIDPRIKLSWILLFLLSPIFNEVSLDIKCVVPILSCSSTSSKEPIHFFFIERYQQAYRDQLSSFIEMINSNSKPKVTFEDGRKALIIANPNFNLRNFKNNQNNIF